MYCNWYKVAKINQEAGLRETLPAALLAAIISVMGGMNVWSASRQYDVEPEAIEQALSNPSITNAISNEKNKEKSNQKEQEFSQEQLLQENIIARTIYAEGRSEGSDGMNAIATVIYNRGNGNPQKMIEEIKKPLQFSCWNKAGASDWTNMKQGKGSSWDTAMSIAHSMINGTFQPVDTWNHYYNPSIADPSWGYTDKSRTQLRPFDTIGNHKFLTL